MTTLAYSDTDLRPGELSPVAKLNKAMQEFYKENLEMLKQGCVVRIACLQKKKSSAERQGKRANEEALARLLSASGAKTMWQKDSYDFDFKERVYKRGSERLHLTALQQLALYQVLVRSHDTAHLVGWASIKFEVRRMHGSDFLDGYI